MEQEEANWKRPLFPRGQTKMLDSNMLSHQVCESKSLFESVSQHWLEQISCFGHLFSFLELFVCAASLLVGPSRLPDSSLAAVYHTVRCTAFYPPWLLWSSECIGTLAFSMYSYNPLFSVTQRQEDSSAGRRLPFCLIARAQDHHLWPREILGASHQSVPTDNPCSLSDAVFLRCCILVHEVMVIHCGSWWQYGSYQRNMKEGVSQCAAWRPETSIW